MQDQRMICIVPRHLSGIASGIQALHAVVEYSIKFNETLEWKKWSKRSKTLVLLESHTTQQLDEVFEELKGKLKYPVAKFIEPDLGDAVTAICFLIGQSVWDTKSFPDGDSMEDLALRRIKNQFNLASN